MAVREVPYVGRLAGIAHEVVTAVIGMAWQGPTGDTAFGARLELVHNRRGGLQRCPMLWVRDLGILALLGVAEAQSLGEVLKLQEPAKDERVGGHTRTKLDELYRQGGVYNGRRILDESFVSEATPSAEWRPAWLRLRLPLVGHADRDDAGLQRHRTVRPAGRCGSRPRASGCHLQWLLSAAAIAGGGSC